MVPYTCRSNACGLRSSVLACLLCLLLQRASPKLLMVYYMHRHGARNVLPKSSLLSENNATGGPALLPAGHKQLQQAGAAFRARYVGLDTCSKANTCLGGKEDQYGILGREEVGYHNYNTWIRSSGLDRTIHSAAGFTAGLFPLPYNTTLQDLQQDVPVYTTPDKDDWLIRAYTKCPTYHNRLQQWYVSNDFKKREQQSAPLRNRIGDLNPQMNVSLSTWWNVYDVYNTVQNFGFGGPLPMLDADTFEQVVELAQWLESAKMQYRFTSHLLGGPIVSDLLKYLDTAASTPANGMYYKLVGLSAHYNTLMSVLSALKLGEGTTAATYPWTSKFPEMAAVVVFELHADDAGNQAIRLVIQDGPTVVYEVVPLPCAAAPNSPAYLLAGAGACSYSDFVALAKPQALGTPAQWCGECNNSDVGVCQLYWANQANVKLLESRDGAGSDGLGREATIIIAILAAVAGLALLSVLALSMKLHQTNNSRTGQGPYPPMLHAL